MAGEACLICTIRCIFRYPGLAGGRGRFSSVLISMAYYFKAFSLSFFQFKAIVKRPPEQQKVGNVPFLFTEKRHFLSGFGMPQSGTIEVNMKENLIEQAAARESWLAFLSEKREKQHLSRQEEQEIQDFIQREGYLPLCRACREGCFPSMLPVRRTINKEGSRKKRVIYTFPGDEGIFLKFIAHGLTGYEDLLPDNCYAFRSSVGVKEAIELLQEDSRAGDGWCLKVDISDYFNSIDVPLLLPKLAFLRERDEEVYRLLVRLLTREQVMEKGQQIREKHGIMAGTPTAPFLANLYLADVDRFFEEQGVLYLRYSDDILLFADSREELAQRQRQLYGQLTALKLSVNPDKVSIAGPGQGIDFLGIAYRRGEIDLSANTLRKTKAKIRRKSEALRRWQRKKGVSPDKAAIALARTMNRKFYGYGDPVAREEEQTDAFTWSRWFFPLLTTDRGLKEIDACLQEYLRYTVTGRHYKGNYRISYEQLRQWGYVSLVHEYYRWRERL